MTAMGLAFFNGLRPYWEFKKFQKAIDRLDLKNGEDLKPVLKMVKDMDGGRKELVLFCPGIGIENFEAKQSSLQNSFGSKIERFVDDFQKKSVRIILTTKELPFSVWFLCYKMSVFFGCQQPPNPPTACNQIILRRPAVTHLFDVFTGTLTAV
jgi:hypothetical protein